VIVLAGKERIAARPLVDFGFTRAFRRGVEHPVADVKFEFGPSGWTDEHDIFLTFPPKLPGSRHEPHGRRTLAARASSRQAVPLICATQRDSGSMITASSREAVSGVRFVQKLLESIETDDRIPSAASILGFSRSMAARPPSRR